jgi:hypothetical protein
VGELKLLKISAQRPDGQLCTLKKKRNYFSWTSACPETAQIFFIFYMKNLNRKRPNRKIENSPNPMRPLSFLMTFIAPLSDFGLDLVFPESDVINSVTI